MKNLFFHRRGLKKRNQDASVKNTGKSHPEIPTPETIGIAVGKSVGGDLRISQAGFSPDRQGAMYYGRTGETV
ncbi:MAG: hypothetical protein J5944_10255 [Lentisphaeria bacterium]|nr:hypothetical protein [Lentisphaeria bacterium]